MYTESNKNIRCSSFNYSFTVFLFNFEIRPHYSKYQFLRDLKVVLLINLTCVYFCINFEIEQFEIPFLSKLFVCVRLIYRNNVRYYNLA